MFKKSQYEYIASILNQNTQGLIFDTSYEAIYYSTDTPVAIVPSTSNAFDYQAKEVIPFTELYNQETPFVNASDRAEYNLAYGIFFDLEMADKVHQALDEFRDYMFNNKQVVIDGYNVAFKTVRGNKGATNELASGVFYGTYTLNVYAIATKGYLFTDDDKWTIKNITQDTVVEELTVLNETATYQNQVTQDISNTRIIFDTENYTNIRKFNLYYDTTKLFPKELYELITIGGQSDTYALTHTFNGEQQPSINVKVSTASRTLEPNGFLILTVEFVEV